MCKRKSRRIKQILKEYFDGFWKLHSELFPASYRNDIEETVRKTIRCGTRDLIYARYECFSCEGDTSPVFFMNVKELENSRLVVNLL
ncbi:hypothetical protein EV207_11343 [Scopulibacillus darangshiensis]|uniref:Transposase zinc-binding domain-containing protein n=1 Tax=Scopulibacillus darangshiensis TaxID=442528 RepID=A0A4R2P2P8_9BACL|nr:hypothetical protein EV207_11343 [Scopulibacillus darangshiensis]